MLIYSFEDPIIILASLSIPIIPNTQAHSERGIESKRTKTSTGTSRQQQQQHQQLITIIEAKHVAFIKHCS